MAKELASQALLEFKNVSKAFGSVQANDNVSFQVDAGSIHAFVGENGAGKSTIMKILFGLYQKDSGQIFFRSKEFNASSPIQAKKNGIGMVHQHFMLADPMTALEHVFLDETSNTRGISLLQPLAKKSKRQELEMLSAKFQMPVAWDREISELGIGFHQRIEILKLLHNKADVLILDEPTAVLTPQEVEALFSQLRKLKKDGKTILLITHKLKEVMALADQVTVFRQGKVVANKKVAETSSLELSELMVGRKLQEFPTPLTVPDQEVVFEIEKLFFKNLKNLNLKIHKNEILGVAGVEGNGQSELIDLLLNPARHQGVLGKVEWRKKSILQLTAAEFKAQGFSYFPENRLKQGALLHSDLKNNFILGQHRSSQFQKNGWLKWKQIRQTTIDALKNFDVRPADPKLAFESLSGGNQQKLVVARELHREPSFLLAAQPTRGVDIGAIERIHLEILKVREKKGSVLLVSSDLDELMKLSDRIVVLFQGTFVGDLPRQQFDEITLGRLMTGAQT